MYLHLFLSALASSAFSALSPLVPSSSCSDEILDRKSVYSTPISLQVCPKLPHLWFLRKFGYFCDFLSQAKSVTMTSAQSRLELWTNHNKIVKLVIILGVNPPYSIDFFLSFIGSTEISCRRSVGTFTFVNLRFSEIRTWKND